MSWYAAWASTRSTCRTPWLPWLHALISSQSTPLLRKENPSWILAMRAMPWTSQTSQVSRLPPPVSWSCSWPLSSTKNSSLLSKSMTINSIWCLPWAVCYPSSMTKSTNKWSNWLVVRWTSTSLITTCTISSAREKTSIVTISTSAASLSTEWQVNTRMKLNKIGLES